MPIANMTLAPVRNFKIVKGMVQWRTWAKYLGQDLKLNRAETPLQ